MDPDAFLDYDRLAEMVKSRRLSLRLSINGAARQGAMSPITWTRVERGFKVRELTYAGVDRALDWEQGSAARVLQGGDPSPGPADEVTDETLEPEAPVRYPDDPILQHLWDLPDPDLSDDQRETLVQLYLALRRNTHRRQVDAPGQGQPKSLPNAL
ncbi:hypothetical protein ABT352_22610 [Streptosporangium sp. NPDC000563]|uniref:hypothetical protein n=1 Tax=Streptosporangium sp. NPDC000563 TaxID=3154366 RepID=UPI003330471B